VALLNANLSHADLREANLAHAKVGGAHMRNANVAEADFTRVEFAGTIPDFSNFSKAKHADIFSYKRNIR